MSSHSEVRGASPEADAAETRKPSENEKCSHCGSSPAIAVTLRQETGKIIWRTRHWIDSTVCRQCGIALFRRMQNTTLTTGWWGVISFFVNWTTVVRNMFVRRELGRLPDPRPNRSGSATLSSPMDPGRPVFLRLGFLIFVALVAWVVFASLRASSSADSTAATLAGQCIVLDRGGQKIEDFVSCSDRHDARVVEVVSDSDRCPSDSDYSFTRPGQSEVLCAEASR